MSATSALELYDRTAVDGAARIIRAYSTSFGLASRLCDRPARMHLADIYALVRIADEIVDGPAEAAGLDGRRRRELLDRLEAETEQALHEGYSANLVVHAFAGTARTTGFGVGLTRPFFASMRLDLDPIDFRDEAELDAYVYGSAEVIGLMCLRAFSVGLDHDPARDARWERGARALGSAFQRVNFLRDLGEDYGERGRRYFPGLDPSNPGEGDKRRILDRIDDELAVAGAIVPELPDGSRRAVAAAHAVFRELAERLRRTPAAALATARVRVPNGRKLLLLGRAATVRHRPAAAAPALAEARR